MTRRAATLIVAALVLTVLGAATTPVRAPLDPAPLAAGLTVLGAALIATVTLYRFTADYRAERPPSQTR